MTMTPVCSQSLMYYRLCVMTVSLAQLNSILTHLNYLPKFEVVNYQGSDISDGESDWTLCEVQ
jgi:hypothetical protein